MDFRRGAEMPTTLTSPGWPDHHYPNKIVCRWILFAEEGYRIMARLTEFLIEADSDYLIFGNGMWGSTLLKISG